MPVLLALALALTVLGVLAMLGAAWRMSCTSQRWPPVIFEAGAHIFGLALAFWLIVAVAAFFATGHVHAT